MYGPPISYFRLALYFAISFGCGLVFMLASSSSGSSRLELTELKLGQYSSPSIRHCFRLLVEKLRTLSEIYSHQNVRYTHRRKLYRVSDVFEEGYNELINMAINLALTCIAQRNRIFFFSLFYINA